MTISVLIPTYRRPQDLRRCLNALEKQTHPADEVIIVVRDTDEETVKLLDEQRWHRLCIKKNVVSEAGVVAAMTAGLASAQGEIVALTDDDTAAYPSWLERIESYFAADNKIGGVGGRDWQPNKTQNMRVVGKVQWWGRVIGNHHLGAGPARAVELLKGCNCAYRTAPLQKIGFEKRLLGNGAQVHWELCLGLALKQAGWKLVYDPAVSVDHFPAQRHDDDQMLRGGKFSRDAQYNASYNETIALWDYFPPTRRAIFLVWSELIGTATCPGILQLVRLVALRKQHAFGIFRATREGRYAAIHALRSQTKHVQNIGPYTKI